MRCVFFLLLIPVTYYLAGMFHSLFLMILCLAEFAAAVFSLVLVCCLRRKVSVSFCRTSDTVRVEETAVCGLSLRSAARLPAGRCVLTVEAYYESGGDWPAIMWKNEMHKKIESKAERGKTQSFFRVFAPFCGLIRLRIKKIRVYDYFSVFSSAGKLSEEMYLAVFPKGPVLRIGYGSALCSDGSIRTDRTENLQGEARHEVRQVREYRSGDPVRSVHWNLSARSGSLKIREYEREREGSAEIFLDTDGLFMMTACDKNSFYILVYALVSGLLEETASVRVSWPDTAPEGGAENTKARERGQRYENPEKTERKGDRLSSAEVRNAEECRDLLYRLYLTEARMKKIWEEKTKKKNKNIEDMWREMTEYRLQMQRRRNSVRNQKEIQQTENMLILDTDLALYSGRTLIFKFSDGNLEEEIRKNVFLL